MVGRNASVFRCFHFLLPFIDALGFEEARAAVHLLSIWSFAPLQQSQETTYNLMTGEPAICMASPIHKVSSQLIACSIRLTLASNPLHCSHVAEVQTTKASWTTCFTSYSAASWPDEVCRNWSVVKASLRPAPGRKGPVIKGDVVYELDSDSAPFTASVSLTPESLGGWPGSIKHLWCRAKIKATLAVENVVRQEILLKHIKSEGADSSTILFTQTSTSKVFAPPLLRS